MKRIFQGGAVAISLTLAGGYIAIQAGCIQSPFARHVETSTTEVNRAAGAGVSPTTTPSQAAPTANYATSTDPVRMLPGSKSMAVSLPPQQEQQQQLMSGSKFGAVSVMPAPTLLPGSKSSAISVTQGPQAPQPPMRLMTSSKSGAIVIPTFINTPSLNANSPQTGNAWTLTPSANAPAAATTQPSTAPSTQPVELNK